MERTAVLLDCGVNEAWLDAEGRPLGEGAIAGSGAPIELRVCPWSGSRHQHPNPMNVSALKQLSAHWDAALSLLASLRAAFVQRRQRSVDAPWELWRLVETGLSWPAFLVYRRDAPAGLNRVPTLAAVVYKLIKGLAPICHHLAVMGVVSARSPRVMSSDALFAWAEAHGKLIGEREVCAGSEAQIRQVLGVLVDGSGVGARAEVDPQLIAYGACFSSFGILRLLHDLERTVAIEDSRLALDAGPHRARLAAVLEELQPGPLSKALQARPARDRAALTAPLGQLLDDDVGPLGRALASPWERDVAPPAWIVALERSGKVDRGLVSLVARLEQVDQLFLDACVPLCRGLRASLGHDPHVPLESLDGAFLESVSPLPVRQAIRAITGAPWELRARERQ